MLKHGGFGDRRYNIGRGVLQRCNNKKSTSYRFYGAIGVECRIGNSASEVYNNILKIDGYFDGAQLDRIDCNGHYELGNLRWVTKSENSKHKKSKKEKEYYSKNPVLRQHFKSVCTKRGWSFDDFEEIKSDKKYGRASMYVYISKEGR